MYVYDYNTIMTTPMMNISNKETIRASTELRTGFKLCVINPGIHIMDNKASTVIKKGQDKHGYQIPVSPPK